MSFPWTEDGKNILNLQHTNEDSQSNKKQQNKMLSYTDVLWTHHLWLPRCRQALTLAKISCVFPLSRHQNLSTWSKIPHWTSSMYKGMQKLKIISSNHFYTCHNMVRLIGLQQESPLRLLDTKEPLPIATNYCNLPAWSGSPETLPEPWIYEW